MIWVMMFIGAVVGLWLEHGLDLGLGVWMGIAVAALAFKLTELRQRLDATELALQRLLSQRAAPSDQQPSDDTVPAADVAQAPMATRDSASQAPPSAPSPVAPALHTDAQDAAAERPQPALDATEPAPPQSQTTVAETQGPAWFDRAVLAVKRWFTKATCRSKLASWCCLPGSPPLCGLPPPKAT